MIRNVALWAVTLAVGLLLLILREERRAAQGKIPMGRLRRLWFGVERRKAPRYRVDWSVRYQRSEDLASSALARDMSQTGAGLTLMEKVPPGSHLNLELPVPGRQVPLRVTAVVVWSKEVTAPASEAPGRRFFVGVHFKNMSGELQRELSVLLKVPGYPLVPEPAAPSPAAGAEVASVYAALKRRFWLAELGLTVVLFCALLFGGIAQDWARWVETRIGFWPLQVAVYTGLLWLVSAALTFPLDWLRGFRLEHRFGLSNQNFQDWLKDYLKQLALGAAFGLAVVEGFSLLLRAAPGNWWFWAAAAWIGWSLALTHLMPTLLIPLFYKQQPLEPGDVRQRLETLLTKCGTRVNGIFSINLSRTTKKANACLCGLGSSRRVLVSDTLLSRYPPEEIEVVMAHELGHHRRNHIGILIGMSAATAVLSCFLVAWWGAGWMRGLNITGWSDLSALPLVGFGLFAVGLATMPLTQWISRRLERQADEFALDQTRNPAAFVGTMRRLAEQNMAESNPPRWAEWLLYDHPTISQRIALAEKYKPRG